MPSVRTARVDDLPAIGRSLAAAFDGDPVWRWMASPKADWSRSAAPFFATEARGRLGATGRVLVDDGVRGAAVWAAPGHWRATARETVAVAPAAVRLFRANLARGLRTLTTLEKHHPREPHWYLTFLGTDPEHQGHGIGSALIEPVTLRCDQEGLPAYLESSKEANVPFYRRHGFEVTGELDCPGGGPKMWLMRRDPCPPELP